ncbi:MAG TPA: flagellar filament capping protein FliD [Thermoclostridium sp.]
MAQINSTTMRLVGMASGLDTDTIIQQLMSVEKLSVTKLERQKQLVEWKQEAYREFTNALRAFKEQFFDITKRSTYLLSDSAFKVFKVSSSADEYVTAKGTITSQAGSHTVTVKNLATAAKAVGIKGISKPITGELNEGIELGKLKGQTLKVTLDGVTKEIALEDYASEEQLEKGLQDLLNDAFGEKKVNVSVSNGKIQFLTEEGVTRMMISGGTALSDLGLTPGASNRISTGNTLATIAGQLKNAFEFDENGNVSFVINGKEFTFSRNDTLQKVMTTINNDADAKVTISYDEVQDRFTMTAKQTGAGKNISFKDSNIDVSFFEALGLYNDDAGKVDPNDKEAGIHQGEDAVVEIDNATIIRSSNTFTVNGIEYTLKNKHADGSSATISVERDIDAVYNSIKSFVDEYNKLVDMFNTKLSEKYNRNYQPLSDDEKEAMTEDQIKKWEEKAKTGILRNDALLEGIQRSMRVALIDVVEGVGISLSSIGISSTSYLDKGKLTIDEDKLKAALREKPDEVRELLIKTSDSVPQYDRDLTSEERKVRYKEQGLLHRISDILNDYISTIRNKDGYKGILLEKAGMVGDLSEYNSSLSKEIRSYDEKIKEMYKKLIEKEDSYYKKFSVLETYMSQMNSQVNYLLSQLGTYK